MPGFWDASAIVPLCVPGQHGAGRQLLREHEPVVWWGTRVEITSAISRLKRQGILSARQAQLARQRLALLCGAWREVQPVDLVRELAEAQLDRRELRAGDALQLAAALVWCNQRPRRRSFLCADRRLSQAASEAGFDVIEV